MATIKEYLISIGEFFSSIYDFILDIFRDIDYLVDLTGEFVKNIPNYFGWLPAPVLAVIVTIFTIVVLYKVLGREG